MARGRPQQPQLLSPPESGENCISCAEKNALSEEWASSILLQSHVHGCGGFLIGKFALKLGGMHVDDVNTNDMRSMPLAQSLTHYAPFRA